MCLEYHSLLHCNVKGHRPLGHNVAGTMSCGSACKEPTVLYIDPTIIDATSKEVCDMFADLSIQSFCNLDDAPAETPGPAGPIDLGLGHLDLGHMDFDETTPSPELTSMSAPANNLSMAEDADLGEEYLEDEDLLIDGDPLTTLLDSKVGVSYGDFRRAVRSTAIFNEGMADVLASLSAESKATWPEDS